jgi:PAS domain S-box-containing protein
MLAEAAISADACASLPDLIRELDCGAGFVIVTEEALATAHLAPLAAWIADQQEWSDLPFVLLTTHGGGLERNPAAQRYLDVLGNVTFIERPFHPTTLVSVARASLRGRQRQYEARARLEALRDSEGRFEAIANSIDQIIWSTRPDGSNDYYNQRWYDYTGMARGSTDGDGWNAMFHPEDRARAWALWQESLATGEPYHIEYRLRHRSGQYRWVLGRAQCVRDSTGTITRWYGTCTDIQDIVEAREVLARSREDLERAVAERTQDLMHAEEALRQSQKMEAIGQLTGGVAHDFNNMLTIIKSSTDLLRRPNLTDERRRHYVDAISTTVDRASKLTSQLLAFARRQALNPEVFDVAERILAVTDMLRTLVGSRIDLVTEISSETCCVEADASQLETALVNMVVNARDAMEGQGTLTIRVDIVSQIPAIRGHGGGQGQFVAVSVADTGTGVSPDTIAHIFEPFFTTKGVGKGTGLGLSQVYGFAKQSGGDVNVESEVARGTTFTVYLPRVEPKPATDAMETRSEPAPTEHGRGRRVLVVEDNLEVGMFSTQILQDLGYETTWAANGDEALKVLAEGNGFEVVFSDVVMPGMSGVDLGREIRRQYPGLPVVLTSGYSHVLAQEGRHGFELLQKPYAAEDLSRVLHRLTRSGQRKRKA